MLSIIALQSEHRGAAGTQRLQRRGPGHHDRNSDGTGSEPRRADHGIQRCRGDTAGDGAGAAEQQRPAVDHYRRSAGIRRRRRWMPPQQLQEENRRKGEERRSQIDGGYDPYSPVHLLGNGKLTEREKRMLSVDEKNNLEKLIGQPDPL